MAVARGAGHWNKHSAPNFDTGKGNHRMFICVLSGSPRRDGNTETLVAPFLAELKANGITTEHIYLPDLYINGCRGCYNCQNVHSEPGCVQQDDWNQIADSLLRADCIVFATPIYDWFCTVPMKAVLDRTYSLNKFYGRGSRKAMLGGKKCAIIATHGYDADYAASPFETAIKRWSKHSDLDYLGMYSVRDENDKASFTSDDAQTGAKEFARYILDELIYAASDKRPD